MPILKFLTTSAMIAVTAIAAYVTQATEKVDPHITGIVVNSLRNLSEDLYVKIALNNSDPLTQQDNIGKSQPIMLSEIRRTRENGIPINNNERPMFGVLLDSGSHIQFQLEVKNPGPCGFGFSIKTGKGKIAEKLYCVDTEVGEKGLRVGLNRYQNEQRTIKVDDFITMGIEGKEEKTNYMTCQVDGWKVNGFVKDGISYPVPPRPKRESAIVTAKVKGGAIHEGCASVSTFESISNVIDGKAIGSLTFLFFVFANLEEKERFYNAYQELDLGDF